MAVSYNSTWLNQDNDEPFFFNWIMRAITGGTVFNLSQGYFAGIDFFPDSPDINDALYYACPKDILFNGFKPNIGTAINGSPVLAFEYWNGSAWTAFSGLSDASSNFTLTGVREITWTLPTDWAKTTVNSKNYYWMRIRLTAVTNITEGGKLASAYPFFMFETIYVSSTDSVTPASLLASDVAGGWGKISLLDNVYKFIVPLVFKYNAGATFTVDGVDLQFGTTVRPMIQVFTGGNTYIINPKTGTYLTGNNVTTIRFFRGGEGDTSWFGTLSSQFNNLTIWQSGSFRFSPQTSGTYYNCNFKNVLPYKDGNYERVNFITIPYFLTTPVAVYNNCYFKNSSGISVDPKIYTPVLENCVFDIPTAQSPINLLPFGTYPANQVYVEMINCSFPQNNKYNYAAYFVDTVGNFGCRMIHSNRFNLNVIDENGDPISGATVSVLDAYGNTAIMEEVTGSPYPNAAYLIDATTITVNDSSEFIVNKYYWVLGEIIKVTAIPTGTTLTVERAKYNTYPYQNNNAKIGVPFFLIKDSLTTDANGDINELKIIERIKHRNGAVDTIALLDYTPFTLTILKTGYETYSSIIDITDKHSGKVTLKLVVPVRIAITGELFNALAPETGSSAKLLPL